MIVQTQYAIPAPVKDDLLIVERYNGTPVPANRLPIGVYYGQENDFKKVNWQNIAPLLAPSLAQILFPNNNLIRSEIIVTDFVAGINTVDYTLGGTPSIIQFWQGDSLFTMGFPVKATTTQLFIESSDIYTNIVINMIKF
jgi:hypothetical protein